MDSVPVLTFATDATAGSFPVDGTVFSLTTAAGTQIYELDSGPVLVINAAQVADGATVRLTDSNGVLRIFELIPTAIVATLPRSQFLLWLDLRTAQLATALAAASIMQVSVPQPQQRLDKVASISAVTQQRLLSQ